MVVCIETGIWFGVLGIVIIYAAQPRVSPLAQNARTACVTHSASWSVDTGCPFTEELCPCLQADISALSRSQLKK